MHASDGNCGHSPESRLIFDMMEPDKGIPYMRVKNNRGFNTLTVLLGVINLALFSVIIFSYLNDVKKPDDEPPGVIPVQPTPTPEVLATPVPTEVPENTPEPTAEPSVEPTAESAVTAFTAPRPEVKKDPEGRRPDYSDFDWYLKDVGINGMWSDTEVIRDLGEVLGEWKAYILHDPYNKTGESCEMLFNADIEAEQDGISILCDWYYIRYFKDDEPSYQDNDSHFSGTWDNGSIYAEGPGTMELKEFRRRGESQYAFGVMTSRDGTRGIIVLARP